MHKTRLTLLKLTRINFIIFHIYLEIFPFIANAMNWNFLFYGNWNWWRGLFEVFLLLFITVIMSYYMDIKFIVLALSLLLSEDLNILFYCERK